MGVLKLVTEEDFQEVSEGRWHVPFLSLDKSIQGRLTRVQVEKNELGEWVAFTCSTGIKIDDSVYDARVELGLCDLDLVEFKFNKNIGCYLSDEGLKITEQEYAKKLVGTVIKSGVKKELLFIDLKIVNRV